MVFGGIPALVLIFLVIGWGYCSTGACPDNSFQTYLEAGAGLTFLLGISISLIYASLAILFSIITIIDNTSHLP